MPILNSDLGRLYVIQSDLGTLIGVLEDGTNLKMDTIRYEIDQFKARLANIYGIKAFLRGEHAILGRLNAIVKSSSVKQMIAGLTECKETLTKYLNDATPVVSYTKKNGQ